MYIASKKKNPHHQRTLLLAKRMLRVQFVFIMVECEHREVTNFVGESVLYATVFMNVVVIYHFCR